MKDIAATQWARAQRTLATAHLLTKTDPDSAASRAYYAAFHAVSAVFALRGQQYTKHSAVRSALHRELIRTDEWPTELGRAYDDLLESREVADYGALDRVTPAAAREAVDAARRILDFVRRSCPELTAAEA